MISFNEAVEKLNLLIRLKIDSINLDKEMHEKVLAWSVDNDSTYYDSAYVISSKATGSTLLTADDILYEKASKEVPTLHLKEYEGSLDAPPAEAGRFMLLVRSQFRCSLPF